MLNNILKLEGAQALGNDEQKEVKGGASATAAQMRALWARFISLSRLFATAQADFQRRLQIAREIEDVKRRLGSIK
jgi:hypothetical protein